jgi:hypothetical protein
MPKDPTASSKRAPKLDCDGNPVKTKRVKKEKDPNAPKRPLSAYMVSSNFCSDNPTAPSAGLQLLGQVLILVIELACLQYFSQDWRERIKTDNPDVSFGKPDRMAKLSHDGSWQFN